MTAGARYLTGLAAVAAAAGAAWAVLPPAAGRAVLLGAGFGLAAQAPLGWWLIRSLGRERFLRVWGVGMLARLGVLALGAWALRPLWDLPAPAFLGGLAGTLVALVAVEVIVTAGEAGRGGGRAARGAALVALAWALAGAAPAAAQEHGAAAQPAGEIDIMHHLQDAHLLEVPYWKPPYTYPVSLPRFAPLHLGPVTLDLSITKHMVFLAGAAALVGLVFVLVARAVARAQAEGRPPRGFAAALEAIALYLRNEVILPNVGPHGQGYVPYLLTVFFLILTCNLLGLVPWGSTATGNVAVTGALALVSLAVIEVSGVRALGLRGYLGTIFYLPPGLPAALKPVMLVIMTPIEIIGKLAKPFALAIRLFANMTAGHVVVLALIGLTFFFRSFAVGAVASLMATGIMLLELFVAFLQAFVFTLLTSVFIGLMRAEH